MPVFARSKIVIQEDCYREKPERIAANYVGPNAAKLYYKVYELIKAIFRASDSDLLPIDWPGTVISMAGYAIPRETWPLKWRGLKKTSASFWFFCRRKLPPPPVSRTLPPENCRLKAILIL